MAFKDHFSGHATAYHEARPRYPDALFDWLAEIARARELAWDAGCGNGQASCALADRFARVFASDPSASQIANAEARANIDYRVETGEQCTLPTGSADLVTVAQALHWFDFEPFFAEVRRVLKPGGVFAAWAYADCSVTPAVDRQKDRLYHHLTGPYWPAERDFVETGYRTIPLPFGEGEPFEAIAAPRFVMCAEWNLAQFLSYLRSWSATQRYVKTEGHDPVALVERELRDAWEGPDAIREVRWSFHVHCGRLMPADGHLSPGA